MKKIYLARVFWALIFVYALGAKIALSEDFYIEGQFMRNTINSVETDAYSGTVSGITFTNLKANLDFKSKDATAIELGYKFSDKIRFGVQYTEFQLDFSKGSVTGTATDGTTTISAAAEVTEADVNALGLKFDNNVSLSILNTYYDFLKSGSVNPFVGLGIGSANISNATQQELALSITGGVSYDINDKLYLGARISYIRVDPLEDSLGIKYQSPIVISSAISLGYRF